MIFQAQQQTKTYFLMHFHHFLSFLAFTVSAYKDVIISCTQIYSGLENSLLYEKANWSVPTGIAETPIKISTSSCNQECNTENNFQIWNAVDKK